MWAKHASKNKTENGVTSLQMAAPFLHKKSPGGLSAGGLQSIKG
ncbi:hypothetical protein EVA_15946 [gut metagenome]|uniref:Uncharacterized protein n=1 Tax=gut metagenome TaxID=749906 RepID=J9FM03_9ZZZZ